MELTRNDFIRYGRQILYPGLGEEGQRKLKQAHVVVAGLGGLGTPASLYLVCAGIGCITLVDCDHVELSNLNRQILYYEEDIGQEKPSSAVQKLARLNSSVEIRALFKRITEKNIKDIIRGADLVIDALDNLETRFVLNRACVDEGIPFIHGGICGLFGEITTILPGETPCLACILPEAPRRKGALPVFGVTPALVASLQVMEAIKLIAGFGRLLTGRMLYIDGDTMELTFCNLVKRPNCAVCGKEAQR